MAAGDLVVDDAVDPVVRADDGVHDLRTVARGEPVGVQEELEAGERAAAQRWRGVALVAQRHPQARRAGDVPDR